MATQQTSTLKLLTAETAPRGIEAFFKFKASALDRELQKKPESFWRHEGEKKALTLFHHAAKRVPAYADFLKKNHIKSEQVRSIADFQNVPITTKKNYISEYPLEARSWDGALSRHKIIAVSSGTSGEPKFWPRGLHEESEGA